MLVNNNTYSDNFNKIIDRLYNSNKSYDVRSFGKKYINSKKYKRVKVLFGNVSLF